MLLKDIKVLDVSNLLPGPMCSLILADLGAEVIKIESLSGDLMRNLDAVKGKSPYFSSLNRNKKSIALNLKADGGQKIFLELAKKADVIIEGFRPGKAKKLGIGYDSVKKINPKIIYCSISGYGQRGDCSSKAGHDINYSSLSGLLDIMHSRPFVPGVQIVDAYSASVAAFSIIACLFRREKNGKGSYIDISMLDCALFLGGMHIAYRSALGNSKTILSGSMPCYNVYETKDGRHASLGAVEKKFWQSFCDSIKRNDLVEKQFDENINTEVKEIFKSKTLAEWAALNKKYDFCCEPIKKIEEVIEDPMLMKKRVLMDIDGLKQVAMPAIFSSVKKTNYNRAPKLGEHTAEILQKIGYGKESIKMLKKSRAIL